MDAPSVARAEHLSTLLRGYFVAQSVYVAARLGIADVLARSSGPLSVASLATLTGSHEDSLYRMLRALASEGVFEELPGHHFALTPLGSMLRTDVPGSMRPAALIAGEAQYKVWSLFKDSIKQGTPGFERVFRKPLFPFFEDHPDLYALFNQAMTRHVVRAQDAVVQTCVIHPGDTVVDVGGGHGSILCALLEKHPHAKGILFDAPRVIAEAEEVLAGSPVRSRMQLVAGDFLQVLPAGNVMVLASILDMFQDAPARQILRNCRQGLESNQNEPSRLYLVEKLLAPANVPDPAKWDDLNMLMMTGGRERMFEEFHELLTSAGFETVHRHPTMLIEAQ